MLRDRDGAVWVIDWAWSCRGAAWIELVSLAPSVAARGVDPDPILAAHSSTRDVDPAAIDAFICALVGYWEHNSRLPAHHDHRIFAAIRHIRRRCHEHG